MEAENKTNRKPHHGHNMRRFREALGIKQEALAMDMNVSQQTIG